MPGWILPPPIIMIPNSPNSRRLEEENKPEIPFNLITDEDTKSGWVFVYTTEKFHVIRGGLTEAQCRALLDWPGGTCISPDGIKTYSKR